MKGYKIPVVIFVLILMIIGWVSLIGSVNAKTGAKYEAAITEAEEYFERGLYQLSTERYEDALKINENREIRRKLIVAWSLQYASDADSYLEYRSSLLDAIKMYPKDSEFLLEVSELYFDRKQYKDAYVVLQDAIDLGVNEEAVYEKYLEVKYSFKLLMNIYADFQTCEDSRFIVSNDTHWGVIDEKGYKEANFNYTYISQPNSDGMMLFISEADARLIDKEGVVQGFFSTKLQKAGIYEEDLISICEEGVYSYYNIRGDKQFGAYQMAGTFTDGKAAVCVDGKWGLVDTKGNLVLEPTFDDIVLDSQGRYISNSAILAKNGGQYGLYDSAWKPIQNFLCDQADPITKDGIFAFSLNGKWGFADTKGNVIIEPTYEKAKSFSNGLAAVCVNGLWGFIDKEMNIVIPCQFLDAGYLTDKGGCMVLVAPDQWQLLLLYVTNKK